MERLVGKYGYVHSCRPPLRSIFVEVYQWLDQLRRDQVRMTRIPDNIWIELMFAAMLFTLCAVSTCPQSSQVGFEM